MALQARHGHEAPVKRAFLLMVCVPLLASCAGATPPPDWQLNAHLSLKNFEAAYLAGNSRVADAEFARARSELSSTGRADLVARAELTRCALQTASIAFEDCPAFRSLALDAGAPERAYREYLAGRWQGLDVNLLPEQHRQVILGGALPIDPMARLVAAGASLRAGKASPASIAAAIDTASANGWRRPLLAWLGIEEKRASSAGDNEAAARIRRRMELISKGGN